MKRCVIIPLLTLGCFSYTIYAQRVDSVKINQDSVYKNPEVIAMHPKGKDYLRTFIEQNINPAIPVENGAPEGKYTVQIALLVDTIGKISVAALTNLGYGMEKEAIRIMKKLPIFIPARQNGFPVKSLQIVPVLFWISKGFN
ncbi:MAG: hypothetical protein IPH18_04345 [Chitinophagaceae bacterium]|nr:hypothetical protein [Chitinophagaceae bacterium]